MKKGSYFIVFSLLSIILIASFVSAYFSSARSLSERFINDWVDFLQPILQAVLGSGDWSGLYLFERLLLFILLVSIVYLAIGRITIFENQRAVKWIIAIIVPLIGVRYLNYEWLNSIIMQYQLLFIVLTAILPFLIFFFFVYNLGDDYPILRKTLWIFFVVVYAGLWATSELESYSDVYAWTTVIAVAFIFLDTRIQRYFALKKLNKAGAYWKYDVVARIDGDIRMLQASSLPNKDKLIRQKEKEKAWWLKKSAH